MKIINKFGFCILLFLLLTVTVQADLINNTQADGLVGYEEANSATPLYRAWNESNNFTLALSALSIGTNTTDDITWTVVRGIHERDQIIMGTEDKVNDVNIQVYQDNDTWGHLLEISTDVQNSAMRAFDIGIEDVSGRALIVYENTSTNDDYVVYRTWNGTDYSSEFTLDTGFTDTTTYARFITLVPKKGDDKIMLLVHNGVGDLYAIEWNGTDFDTAKELEASVATTSNTEEHFAFAWEESSGEGVLIYGEGNNLVYRTYDLTDPYWSTEATIALGNGLDSPRLCSNPLSDHIGMIWQDGGNDVNVRMWDGSALLASPPSEDPTTEPNGANSANVDCAWLNSTSAMFGFIDLNALSLDYLFFSVANTWSTSNLDTTTDNTGDFAADDIQGIRFAKHPTQEEVMIIVSDLDSIVRAIRWDGSSFVSPTTNTIEDATEVSQGDQESVMFTWYEYDVPPAVTSITANETSYSLNDNVDFNVTVIDTVNISSVWFNVTLPNGSVTDLLEIINTSEDLFTGTFNTTDVNGVYTLRIIANDTSTHENYNQTETLSIKIGDTLTPNVTFVEPTNATATFPQDFGVNITVNVTDETSLDAAMANVTLPNGTMDIVYMDNVTSKDAVSALYEFNETKTDLVGTYTIRIEANDTANNINDTASRTFFIGDGTEPDVFNLVPINDSNFDNFTAVEIAANVSDLDSGIDYVYANITLPNGTLIEELQLENVSEADIFNATLNVTDLIGYYNVSFFANDSAGIGNGTEKTNFTIGDFTIPNEITLNAPGDETNFTVTTLDFNFTVFDDSTTDISCDFRVNNNVEATNATTLNDTLTNFQLTSIADNKYEWNVTCTDNYGNENTSVSNIFRVDTLYPNFTSLTTAPDSVDDLDIGVNVTAIANVSDDVMNVGTVILQYRTDTNTTYNNLTMTLDSGNLYNVTFNATDLDIYFLRVHANDTLDNTNVSAEVNFTIAAENTWVRSPSNLGTVSANAGDNVSIGTLVINNTGDSSLDFNITSDYDETYFNDSVDFTLAAGAVNNLDVNASRSSSGTTQFTLTINASSGADPASQTTTGTLVVAPGQAILTSTVLTPTEEEISVTRGQTNVEFKAELNNSGEGNATNLTFFFGIPDEWTVTFGDTNISIDELLSNESQQNTIEVTIPNNATIGLKEIEVNSTGVNESGTDLASLDLIFGDTINVTVGAVAAVLGVSEGSADVGGSGGASVGSGAVGGVVSKAGSGETLFTIDSITIVRGKEEDTPIVVSNLFENAVMKNIHLELEGFLAQYVTIKPQEKLQRNVDVKLGGVGDERIFAIKGIKHHKVVLDEVSDNSAVFTVSSNPVTLDMNVGEMKPVDLDGDSTLDTEVTLKEINNSRPLVNFRDVELSKFSNQLNFGESVNYTMNIFAPAYLSKENINLTLNIKSDLVALNPGLAGFTSKSLTEIRTILLKLHEVSEGDVEALFKDAFSVLKDMENEGFFVKDVNSLYDQAQSAFDKGDLELAGSLLTSLLEMGSDAFEANTLIKDLQDKISRVKSKFLNISDTERALALALKAFKEGDFSLALERAKETQLTYILETKGTINFVLFLTTYWWVVLLGLAVALIIGNLTYRRLAISIIAQRLKNLIKEEKTIMKLMKEAQFKTFKKKEMSESQYHKSMYEFETRLDKIRTIRAKLRNKKSRIVKTEKELANLKKEHLDVIDLLKKAQNKYLVKGKMTRDAYLREDKIEKERLVEIEEEESLLKEKLEKERGSKKYFILNKISKITDVFEDLLDRIEGKLPAKKVKVTYLKKEKSHEEKQFEKKLEKREKESKKKGFSLPKFEAKKEEVKPKLAKPLVRKEESEDKVPSRQEIEDVFGKLKTNVPKSMNKEWVGYKLDKGSSAMMMLEKFDLLHLFHKPEEVVKEVSVPKPIKRMNLKELEKYFPIVAADLRKKEEVKTSSGNVARGMRWLFG